MLVGGRCRQLIRLTESFSGLWIDLWDSIVDDGFMCDPRTFRRVEFGSYMGYARKRCGCGSIYMYMKKPFECFREVVRLVRLDPWKKSSD